MIVWMEQLQNYQMREVLKAISALQNTSITQHKPSYTDGKKKGHLKEVKNRVVVLYHPLFPSLPFTVKHKFAATG